MYGALNSTCSTIGNDDGDGGGDGDGDGLCSFTQTI